MRPLTWTRRGVASRGRGATGAALAAALGLCLVTGGAMAQPKPAPPPPLPLEPQGAPAPRPLSETLTGMAKAEYGAGVALFKDDDFAGALARFERTYELSRDHRLLWNVALCQKNLRRYVALLATARRLEDEAKDALSAGDRRDLAELVAAAEAFVTRLEITSSEPGATVLIDDEVVGTTPLSAPVTVDIGERRVRITKPGFTDFTRTERASGGDSVTIAAKLEKAVHRGRLVLVAGPDDLIALDGKAVGRARWEGVVPSGTRALRVTAPGMIPHTSEILIKDDEVRRIDITLTPTADRSVTGRLLWIGGGVALLTGAVIAGAVIFQPGRPAEQGSLGSFPLSFGGR